jgi:hypothetical protein
VAASTVTNPTNTHRLFANATRALAPADRPKAHSDFRVFPTGESEYSWCIVALATNRTVSHHKSLAYALRKCTRLNEQRDKAQLNPLDIALSGFPDVNTYRAYYEGLGNDFE